MTAASFAVPTSVETVPVVAIEIPEPFLLTTSVSDPLGRGRVDAHAHPEGMLMWSARGTTFATLGGSLHTLTVGHGVWVPAFTAHTMQVEPGSIACCTYFADSSAPDWSGVRTLELPTALRELLLHLAAEDMPDGNRLRAQRVVRELLPERSISLGSVPVPSDERVAPLVQAVLRDPSDDRTIEDWSWQLALSVRTVSRIFATDIGMPFSHWRTSVRMMAAVRLLGEGAPVSLVAQQVGYSTTSAFSAAFRRSMGMQPSSWGQSVGAA